MRHIPIYQYLTSRHLLTIINVLTRDDDDDDDDDDSDSDDVDDDNHNSFIYIANLAYMWDYPSPSNSLGEYDKFDRV